MKKHKGFLPGNNVVSEILRNRNIPFVKEGSNKKPHSLGSGVQYQSPSPLEARRD